MRSVLVTGASTGIGEACVLELDRRGFRVFAGVRAESDAERLHGKASERLVPLILDVTNAGQIAAAAATVRQSVGQQGLDGLVNNAGIAVSGPLEVLAPDKLREQFEVNVIGQVAVAQAMIPLLRVARGRIVNIGSISGRIASPYVGPYAASKFALEALTDTLRMELRQWGIFVCIVEPANVKTPIWGKAQTAVEGLIEQASPEHLALYASDIEAMLKATTQMAHGGMPVEKVVRAVMHALSARRPKTRYPVGTGTRFFIQALKFVPGRIRDQFVLRTLGLQ
jgi:NAD(P)-dependent dehydrogenase (short-subunit alcohol dehydrogenase family)